MRELGKEIEVREEHLWKAPDSIVVTLFGMEMSVKAVSENRFEEMAEKALPSKLTEDKEEQLEKAYSPKEVTPSGITMEVREEHLKKHILPSEVTPGMETDFKERHSLKEESESAETQLGRLRLSIEEPEKALSPMRVTLPSEGITLVEHPARRIFLEISVRQLPLDLKTEFPESTLMERKAGQSSKTEDPTLVTLEGMAIDSRLTQ